jgi:hypothetical protein
MCTEYHFFLELYSEFNCYFNLVIIVLLRLNLFSGDCKRKGRRQCINSLSCPLPSRLLNSTSVSHNIIQRFQFLFYYYYINFITLIIYVC